MLRHGSNRAAGGGVAGNTVVVWEMCEGGTGEGTRWRWRGSGNARHRPQPGRPLPRSNVEVPARLSIEWGIPCYSCPWHELPAPLNNANNRVTTTWVERAQPGNQINNP